MPAGGTVGAVFTSPGARPGDEVDPYIDETFIQLLEVATASVRVAVDRLDHPGMQEAILEAWDRGLDVQVVADADNDKYSGFDLLEGAGVPVIWQPAGAPEMHNKYVIVDEAVVWTGSLSMTTTALLYNNHASIFLADEALAAVSEEENLAVGQLKALFGGHTGYVRIFVPESVLAVAGPSPQAPVRRHRRAADAHANAGRLANVKVWVRAEIGQVEISSGDLAQLRERDVVLVDGLTARPDQGQGGTAKLKLGLARAGCLGYSSTRTHRSIMRWVPCATTP
jgi:flagellar motor switch/type III secretory pathway protein FliN